MIKRKNYIRPRQDIVSEEMTIALLKNVSYEFNELFQVVYARLRERNANSGGEEMLRLRLYEKLQNFVTQGLVRKEGKKYTTQRRALEARIADVAAAREKHQHQHQQRLGHGSMLHTE